MSVKIGLEIHVQLNTKTKLFCRCPTKETEAPNEHTCPVCLGFPGSKPMLNKKAVEYAIMVARALNCKVNRTFIFSRKNYFYPDLPKNFQITQYEFPLAVDGFVDVNGKRIRIKRVHLEEDPGRLIHVGGDITTANYVLVDYNRSGIPLVEIVTEPDFESGKEAREFLQELSTMLEYIGVFDKEREGSMRVDANVSVEGGERVEIKNISGFADVEKALNYEILRQRMILKGGGKVGRETRHFDEKTKVTHVLRRKEFEEDYGYIPEPDLVVYSLDEAELKEIFARLPELPSQRVRRIVSRYSIPENLARVIVYKEKALADFFEECCKYFEDYVEIAKWVATDLLKCLNWHGISVKETKITPQGFVEMLKMIKNGEITARLGKEIIKQYVSTGKHPRKILEEMGIERIEESKLREICEEVLRENEKAANDYKNGRKEALQFLIGIVLKKTKGSADPKSAAKVLREMLES